MMGTQAGQHQIRNVQSPTCRMALPLTHATPAARVARQTAGYAAWNEGPPIHARTQGKATDNDMHGGQVRDRPWTNHHTRSHAATHAHRAHHTTQAHRLSLSLSRVPHLLLLAPTIYQHTHTHTPHTHTNTHQRHMAAHPYHPQPSRRGSCSVQARPWNDGPCAAPLTPILLGPRLHDGNPTTHCQSHPHTMQASSTHAMACAHTSQTRRTRAKTRERGGAIRCIPTSPSTVDTGGPPAACVCRRRADPTTAACTAPPALIIRQVSSPRSHTHATHAHAPHTTHPTKRQPNPHHSQHAPRRARPACVPCASGRDLRA